MAARSGMAQLIADVRLMADAGESEHSVGGRTYYTDDDIQRYLDQHRENIYREYLRNEPEYGSGSAEYHYYYFRYAHVEGTASGSLAWLITDGNDDVIAGSLYTPNMDAQEIRFTADQRGSARYLTYRAYDIYRAVSEIWRDKAAHVADRAWDVSTDNHSLKRSQMAKNYMDKAREYAAFGKPKHVRMIREDLNP